MKSKLTMLLVLLTISTSFAQQGINYKAVIKDDVGNIITNQQITIEFSILQGIAQTNVYNERHLPTTDANGIVILNIGNGIVLGGSFSNIDWANNIHALNVQCDIGNGLFDLGTTPFSSVPYTFHAFSATTASNVNGLEVIDEGNGSGWRFIGRNPNSYGNLGFNAVDLSTNTTDSSIYGATGNFSFTTGTRATASGLRSTAMGNNTTASGEFSTALGNNTSAIGESSSSLGFATAANGEASTALGFATEAKSYAETALGIKNTDYTPNQLNTWFGTDRLLVVGNGNSTPSDALIILKNGTITAPSLDVTEIVNDKSLTTKEYFDANRFSGDYNDLTNIPNVEMVSGLESLNEGNGIGWRLKGQLPEFYGNIGLQAVDLSFSGTLSNSRGATGSYSFATGNGTNASGDYSMAAGLNTSAFGDYSVALGRGTAADGNNATAFGFGTAAIGANSTAMGFGTVAYASNETVVGRYNESYTPGNSNTDRLFVVGNGANSSNPNNAFAVLNSGKVGIGTNLPNGLLGIQRNSNSSVPQLELIEDQPDDGARIDFKNAYETTNKWTLYGRADNTTNSSEFNIFYSGNIGNIMSLRGDGNVYVNGSLVHSSDKRLKKDITTLPYGLNEILQLQPKQYFWKNRTEQTHKSLGLIAQDVQDVIANVVHIGNDDKKTLSLSYTELIPVLINAIKEQQAIINKQNLKIEGLTSELETLKILDSRVKQLETLLKTSQR
ncbi:tail fiber domain-containing protein [Winogradskyella sp. R77965]|uniref:tail fiber domain-containing protein n=1 Tax=Winogradskyella sp. R77965 TaxID=3093872 RepID=UPI0037DCD9A5